jgi:RNA polymerase sigma-70 factor (ECF subfamily)
MMNAIAVTVNTATYQPGLLDNSLETANSKTRKSKTAAGGAEARRRAVQDLYESSIEQIYKFVFFKVGNREDAEDITSQVYIKASNLLDIGQDERAQLAWLYQVARTTITDFWRQYYKVPSASLDALEQDSTFQVADEPMMLGAAAEDENAPATVTVDALLASLPENYRLVLEFRFLKSYSLKETAVAMGITEANVKVLQHRALAKAAKLGATLA